MPPTLNITLARAAEIATQAARKGAMQPGAPAYLATTEQTDWAPHDWVIQAIIDAYADGAAAARIAQDIANAPEPGHPALREVYDEIKAIPVEPTDYRMPRMYDAWKHKSSGRIYFVNMVANVFHAADPSKFPKMVIYTHVPTDQTWSRPLDVFLEKFEYVGVKPAREKTPEEMLKAKLDDVEEAALDMAADNLVGCTRSEFKLALKSMTEHEGRVLKPLAMALMKIWRWHGEIPALDPNQIRTADYERDYMRRVAATALKKGSEPLPSATQPRGPNQ